MGKQRGPYRRHDEDFIRETIGLIKNSGKSVAAIGRDLGIHSSTLYYWLKTGMDNEKTTSSQTNVPEETKRLQKELEDVKLERDILKKAVAIFSKQPK